MQEMARMVTAATKKALQQLLRLASTVLKVDALQDGDNVLEQELDIVRTAGAQPSS